jgi:hypothetical protein
MEIASRVGEGTTVTVRMPVLIPAGQAAQAPLELGLDGDEEGERGHA